MNFKRAKYVNRLVKLQLLISIIFLNFMLQFRLNIYPLFCIRATQQFTIIIVLFYRFDWRTDSTALNNGGGHIPFHITFGYCSCASCVYIKFKCELNGSNFSLFFCWYWRSCNINNFDIQCYYLDRLPREVLSNDDEESYDNSNNAVSVNWSLIYWLILDCF